MSEKVQFELGGEFEDKNFTSCFARSVAVNSQYKQTKSLDFKHEDSSSGGLISQKACVNQSKNQETNIQEDAVRFRRNLRTSSFDQSRRHSSTSISNRRSSLISNRISEIPVENIIQQSKIQTLQWQLNEAQNSREMYKALMKQVVVFLEKVHYSLDSLTNRLNHKTVPRSRSEYQITSRSSCTTVPEDKYATMQSAIDDYLAYKDNFGSRPRKLELDPEVTPPEKLSEEAFRLFRTIQSLLNTQEPDLSTEPPENDIEFIAQLAKEFPSQTSDYKPQRTTSFSLSPKLIIPEKEIKISTALNRKLSLQLSQVRRNSIAKIQQHRNVDSARGSVAESEELTTDNISITSNTSSFITKSTKLPEKSNSPPAGSISSVEDESGFSSMNSFQEIGLPLVNSTMIEEVSPKNALLRSMLQNNSVSPCNTTVIPSDKNEEKIQQIDDVKLWEKPNTVVAHKRWHSTPVDEQTNTNPQRLKVLWV